MSNEFSSRSFDCPYRASMPQACVQYEGDFVLASQDVAKDDFLEPWLVLGAILLAYYGLALLFLNVLKFPPSGMVGAAGGAGDGAEVTVDERHALQIVFYLNPCRVHAPRRRTRQAHKTPSCQSSSLQKRPRRCPSAWYVQPPPSIILHQPSFRVWF
jgi:hypothetical protein